MYSFSYGLLRSSGWYTSGKAQRDII